MIHTKAEAVLCTRRVYLGMVILRVPEEDWDNLYDNLRKVLKERGVENSLWSFEGRGVYINMYPSGIMLVQGKDAEEWVDKILSFIRTPEGSIAGCDEAGKGDIFGPLSLCCVLITPENFKEVLKTAPKDSKRMKDDEIFSKAKRLRRLVKSKCINLVPERFNELYRRYRNINRLMDSAYRKLIREMGRFRPQRIVVDRYSRVNPFQDLKDVLFIEKGERDVAVSVASILARYKFLKTLRELEKEAGIRIPKGASGEAKHLAKELLEKNPELARKVIKLSFLD